MEIDMATAVIVPGRSGLIGTTGTSTDLLYPQIVRSFNGKKSLVVATLHGEDMPLSTRNNQMRNTPKRS
jgi:hypothetical protein